MDNAIFGTELGMGTITIGGIISIMVMVYIIWKRLERKIEERNNVERLDVKMSELISHIQTPEQK